MKRQIQESEEVSQPSVLGTGSDAQAFAQLYDQFYPTVKKFLANHNAPYDLLDDLAQEAFTRLWKHRNRFRNESTFLTYLLSIALNILRNERRNLARISPIHLTKLSHLVRDLWSNQLAPEIEMERKELVEAVRQAKSQLPVVQRQAIELVDILGMPVCEAAKRLGCPSHTFYSRLYRARRHMCKLLAHLEL